MSLSDDHLNALQRMDQGASGRHGKPRQDWYGPDTYPLGTVLVFQSGRRPPWAAVKVTARAWELTGRMRPRTWQGLMRTVGPGYKMTVVKSPQEMLP